MVQGVHGRERERAKGVEKRLKSDLKYKGARCTAGLCAGEAVVVARGHGRAWLRVGGLPGRGLGLGKERGREERARGGPGTWAAIGGCGWR